MKLSVILVFITCFQSFAINSLSQNRINLNIQNSSIEAILKSIEGQGHYSFVYKIETLPRDVKINVYAKDATLEYVMDRVLQNTDLSYKKVDKNLVVILGKGEAKETILKTITGTITNEKGEPLEGVSVNVKGQSRGTVTNAMGQFFIDVGINSQLIFSHVGYTPQEVLVTSTEPLNIVLASLQAVQEDSIVVVGYGKQKRASVVSAISTVKGEDLRFSGRSLSTNLAGQVAGLIAVQRSGEPGYDNADFWIRGISTYAGGSRPLVLVDGVPRSINDIEADEIESFNVLKDASATAVYGAEGANGVVLITSKRGRIQKPIISFRTEHTILKPMRLPQYVGSVEYMKLYNEALNNDGQPSVFTDSLINLYATNADADLYPNTNWINSMLRPYTQNHRYTLNVRGGAGMAKYFVSGAYYGENGIFVSPPKKTDYNNNIGLQRFNLRSNIDLDVSKTTKVSVDLAGQYLITNYPGTGTGDIFRMMTLTPPYIFPAVYSDGTIATHRQERDGNMKNPYNLLVNSGYTREWRSMIQSAVTLQQQLGFITNGLSYRGMVSYDYNGNFFARRAYNPSRYYATGRDANGKLIFSRTFAGSDDMGAPTTSSDAAKKVYIEQSLNYSRSFDKHTVTGMVLYMQKEEQAYNNALAFRKQGVVGRATYGYDTRYFLEGSFGYTGSETFAPGKRFGFFPAIGLAYLISNEKFYPEAIKKVVSTLKFRASAGRTGNDNTGGARFLYRPTFNTGANGFNQGITTSGGANGYGNGIIEGLFQNDNISWEIENKQNYGADIYLFNNSVKIVADYFKNERYNILLQRRTVVDVAGFRQAPWQNFGRVKAWGFDGSLEANHEFNSGLSLGARGTFTFTRNKILEYDELPQPFPWMAVTNTRVSENTVYIAERLYTEEDFIVTQNSNGTKSYKLKSDLPASTLGGLLGPGDIKYKDLNGDGIIDQFDRKRGIGNPYVPEIVYGFGLNAQYKGFYASVFFQGVGNTSVLINNGDLLGSGGNALLMPFQWAVDQSSFRTFALDRWTTANPNENVFMPRLHSNNVNSNNNTVNSTWWLRNGSFLRFKNAEIGYNISDKFLSKFRLKKARFYIMGTNLFLWDHIKLWDPETGNYRAGTTYPNTRNITFGFETSF